MYVVTSRMPRGFNKVLNKMTSNLGSLSVASRLLHSDVIYDQWCVMTAGCANAMKFRNQSLLSQSRTTKPVETGRSCRLWPRGFVLRCPRVSPPPLPHGDGDNLGSRGNVSQPCSLQVGSLNAISQSDYKYNFNLKSTDSSSRFFLWAHQCDAVLIRSNSFWSPLDQNWRDLMVARRARFRQETILLGTWSKKFRSGDQNQEIQIVISVDQKDPRRDFTRDQLGRRAWMPHTLLVIRGKVFTLWTK